MRVISYFQGLLFYKINTKIILDIKLDLLKKINKLPLKINKKYGTGYLISRINDDTDRLRSLFADTFISIVKDILTFMVGLTAIFIIHWKLAIISIAILPFFILATIYFSRIIRRLSKIFYEDSAQTTKQLEESLNMLELSKVFLHYKYNLLRYYQKAKQTFRSDIKLGKTSFLNGAVTGFIGGIAPIVIIGYGGYEIIQGRLTIGSLIAFNSFAGYLFGPTSRLINVNIQIQKALIALQRVQEIFELPEEEIDIHFVIPEKIQQLKFNNVSFSYEEKDLTTNPPSFRLRRDKQYEQYEQKSSHELTRMDTNEKEGENSPRPTQTDADKKDEKSQCSISESQPAPYVNMTVSGWQKNETKNPVNPIKEESFASSRLCGEILKEISFTAKEGEKVGIVGSSGCGKTTLLRLLAGLYEINSGEIILNEKVLTNKELVALRRYIAVVEQEPFLFNDTIYNNIRFGNPRASREEILSAAKQSHSDEFIKKLPEGYDTAVGSRGGNLSVGQKQRIAIARALVKKPKILILDEATSNIDTISEKFINKTIFSLPEDMLVFIVAHRLTTIKQCDKIFVLDNGRIVEKGTHEKLIEQDGIYQKLSSAKNMEI